MKHILLKQPSLSPAPLRRGAEGFAMLFTVLIVSLILTIALGISDITLKQSILSGLAKDSGIAFYQADAAVECGMYEDTTLLEFPYQKAGDIPVKPTSTFTCGDRLMTLTTNTPNYYEYDDKSALSNQQCFSIVFDKTNLDDPNGKAKVDGQGFNRCGQNPKQVERTLEVKY